MNLKTTISVFVLAAMGFAADAPKLPDSKKVDIKEKQIELAENMLQMNNLRNQATQLTQQQQALSKEIQDLIVAAQASVDKDKKTWELNPRTLEFEAVKNQNPEPPKAKSEVKK